MKNFLRDLKRWWRRGGAKRHRPPESRGGAGFFHEPDTARSDRTAVRRRYGKKRGGFRLPRRFVIVTVLILLLVLFGRAFYRFDRQILPLVLEAAELELQTEINNVINEVIHDIIVSNQVTAADFILESAMIAGAKPVLSINTVLVNEICNAAAFAISERLSNLEPKTVYVPIGMALGLDTLAQVGPNFTFTLAPIGNALVNYSTSFTAVGINQTHFSVWLTVESVVRIINPVQSSEILVTRHVSLVDTIISGVVPDTYLNMDTPILSLN